MNLNTSEHRRTLFGIAMETVVLLAMDAIRADIKCEPSNKSEQMKKLSIIVNGSINRMYNRAKRIQSRSLLREAPQCAKFVIKMNRLDTFNVK